MNFIEWLIESGYVYDDENYDGCYVKQDEDGIIHCYQEGENFGEWNYVRMNNEFDVITENTFTV
jgi:phage antirepressor YoqD-like protein